MDGSELADIGLTAKDVDDLHAAWVSNMKTVVAAIVEKGEFAWQLFNGGTIRCKTLTSFLISHFST